MQYLILILLFISYNLHSQDWLQIGQAITGDHENDRLGLSVDINTDGTRVLVGIPFSDYNGYNSGQVSVFDLEDQNDWSNFFENGINGDSWSDWAGEGVSLSSDGSTVAVGSPGFSENYDDGYLLGKVAVYRLTENEFLGNSN